MTQGHLRMVEAPAHWGWERLWVAAPRVQVVGRPHCTPLSVFLSDGVIPRSSRSDNHNALGENLSAYQVVLPGDLVFNKLRTWQGGLGVSAYEGIVSPAYYVCRPSGWWHPKFLHYLLLSKPYLAELTRLSKFMPPAQFDIQWDVLRTLPLLSPPRSEQLQIANFLDFEAKRIGELVNAQSRVLGLLEERADSRVRSIIADSELGHPGGSEILPLRRMLTKRVRRVVPTKEVVTAFRDGQVVSRGARRAEGFTMPTATEPQGQGVEVGDVVVHGLDGFAGAIGESESSGNCSPVYHVCTPTDGGDPAFYGRLLRVLALDGYLGSFATSIRERAFDFRNWRLFGNIPIPRVDPMIQREIGHLVVGVRPIRQEVARFNERLAERRQALITAAVTGQIDVTTSHGLSRAGVPA